MPRSNSSFGVAPGGSVVSAAVAPGLRGGGGGSAAPAGSRGLVRRLRRGRGGYARLGNRRQAGGRRGCAADLPQALLELPVAVLQFLVLPGELPELVLKPLDPKFQVAIVGLGEGLRSKSERRG